MSISVLFPPSFLRHQERICWQQNYRARSLLLPRFQKCNAKPLNILACSLERRQVRVETNRLLALQRKRALQIVQLNSYCNSIPVVFSTPPSQKLDRENAVSISIRRKTTHLNCSSSIIRPFAAERRYHSHHTSFKNIAQEKIIQDLPPLPESAPKLRQETIQSLSEQQLEVIELARPPFSYFSDNEEAMQQPRQGHMVRITAAAGTGKTTMLLHLAIRCLDLGHTDVTYVTFSRAAASDAKKRILDMMKLHKQGGGGKKRDCITASTLHSCAMRLVQGRKGAMTKDHALQGIIAKEFSTDIDDYLLPAIRHITSSKIHNRDFLKEMKTNERALREQVVSYLSQAFTNFCRSKMTFEQLCDESDNSRHFSPITKNFCEDRHAAILGFPLEIYSLPESYKFYADTCVKLWEYILENEIRTFDTEMKKAQLMNLRIPSSVLLVDEWQDLDECQVDFVAKQANFGTHIFFVGDAAQTVYSFRGARSSYVMSLPNCIDRFLTKSFRFGHLIAQIANIALFVKEHSPQTTEYIGTDKRLWIPYRVEGASKGNDECLVTTQSLLHRDWSNKRPVTIIGCKNVSLLVAALDLMDLGYLKQYRHYEELIDEAPPNDDSDLSKCTPKFHVNGNGETSGEKMWRKAIKQIECLFELFMAQDDCGTLPPNFFPEFASYGRLTWRDFNASCVARGLFHYAKSIHVIEIYGQNTMKAVKIFEAQLKAKHSKEDADFILTTCHAAKGLEWDYVEVCDDFLNLGRQSYVCSKSEQLRPPFMKDSSNMHNDAKPVLRKGWQFDISPRLDDLNVLYVACTRAKKILSLPKSIESLLCEFDSLHNCVNDFKKATVKPLENDKSMLCLPRDHRKLSKGEVWDLHQDLCLPLRDELGVDDDCTIMKTLLRIEDKNDDLENDNDNRWNVTR